MCSALTCSSLFVLLSSATHLACLLIKYSLFVSYSVLIASVSIIFFWNVSNHSHVYQEMTTSVSCVLALTFTISTGISLLMYPRIAASVSVSLLMNSYLPSDKDSHVYLLFCFHLKTPTDNLGNAFEAGKQNLKSLFFQKLFTV